MLGPRWGSSGSDDVEVVKASGHLGGGCDEDDNDDVEAAPAAAAAAVVVFVAAFFPRDVEVLGSKPREVAPVLVFSSVAPPPTSAASS